jgi:hypothetical protein
MAQGSSEHALTDAIYLTSQFGESHGPAREQCDRQQRPFIRDAIQNLADIAVLPAVPLFGRVILGIPAVTE